MVEERNAARQARADNGAGHHHAVIVVDLDPVVVEHADLFRILIVDPEGVAAAGEGQHAVIIAVGGVDAPLAVRGQVVEHDALLVAGIGGQKILQRAVVRLRFVGRQMFAGGDIALMIQVEMLTAGQGAPGNQFFDVETIGRIGAASGVQAAPDRAVQEAAWLSGQIGEGRAHPARRSGQIGQRQADLFFLGFKGAKGHLAVGLGCELENNLGGITRFDQGRIGLAVPGDGLVAGDHLIVIILNRPGETMGTHPFSSLRT